MRSAALTRGRETQAAGLRISRSSFTAIASTSDRTRCTLRVVAADLDAATSAFRKPIEEIKPHPVALTAWIRRSAYGT